MRSRNVFSLTYLILSNIIQPHGCFSETAGVELHITESELAHSVLKSWGLGEIHGISRLGGTAAPKWCIEQATEKFVLRQRQNEFALPATISFDHQMLTKLHGVGLPVPYPQTANDGRTCVECDGNVYELLNWVEGRPFTPGDVKAISGLAEFMAQFHRVSSESIPSGKEAMKREDHPELLMPYVDKLELLCRTLLEKKEIEKIREQISILDTRLERNVYYMLPMVVIHGDVHPGNIMFEGSRVSAVYDFDYMSVQARVRDICDCLAFFTSTREHNFDVNDIHSLTQAFTFNYRLSAIFLNEYTKVISLEEIEFAVLPMILRSLWLNMRLRGCRKVSDDKKLEFVLTDFWRMLDWIENESPAMINELRASVKKLKPEEH
jgi:Ser/Thr protein kinase RdoA (MazF antagonist)